MLVLGSGTAAKIMNPINVSKKATLMKTKRMRVQSDKKARMSKVTAPVTFGATVYLW